MSREFLSMDESIAKLIQQLGEGKPKVLSHLTPAEHSALAVAMAFNVWAKIDILDQMIESYLTLSPARGGRSRKQLTQIGIASMGPPPSDEAGRIERFTNWVRGRKE